MLYDYEKALEDGHACLDLLEKNVSPRDERISRAYCFLGSIHKERKEYEDSLKDYFRAEAI